MKKIVSQPTLEVESLKKQQNKTPIKMVITKKKTYKNTLKKRTPS
jgi:hypothetical protein